jgi:hypothetical protein
MTTFSEVTAEIQAAKQAYQDTLTRIKESGGVADMFRAFFEKNPEIKAVGWTQGTPSFNDPCVFSVYEVLYSKEEVNPEDGVYEDENGWDYVPNKTTYVNNPDYDPTKPYGERGDYYLKDDAGEYIKIPHPDYNADLFELSKFIGGNEDLMEDLFGNGAQIIATPAEIIVETWYPVY